MHPSLYNIQEPSLDKNIFNKLSVRYVIALISIAVTIISSQSLIQNFLKKQISDSRVVNVAGRQRMLSQKITKQALIIFHNPNPMLRKKYLHQLNSDLDLWRSSHYGLIHGNDSLLLPGDNSDTIKHMFNEMSAFFENMVAAVNELTGVIEENANIGGKVIEQIIDRVLVNEAAFLPRMDRIVYQFDVEARQKVRDVMRVEMILLLTALLVLVFEFFFIFQPSAFYIKKTIHSLLQSEEKEKQSYKNIIKLKSEEQKFRSSLIFEGQERERRRLSRDLHDGIGQLLTGLKFQIEAIPMNKAEMNEKKMDELKTLTADIIKEVRRVSFNLRPTVLSDYGLAAGIKHIVKELNKFTDLELLFENETNFNGRLDKKIETHLYRITQESINNALKYSKARKIFIKLWHKTELIGISIKDNGVGFDFNEAINRDIRSESGHGIFNMRERASFINADLVINTKKGKGTEVILYLPLN